MKPCVTQFSCDNKTVSPILPGAAEDNGILALSGQDLTVRSDDFGACGTGVFHQTQKNDTVFDCLFFR
ncbi:hypothetical protein SDC9_209109 [bioreactor metagenome]|uniref:Uncharacterized protein n=1 Tax=bioreactor metagenome TaxID=1076179 RepID=A0A645JP59_9ZZZZ